MVSGGPDAAFVSDFEPLATVPNNDVGPLRLRSGYLYWSHGTLGTVARLPACP
jgi:hypothetical protein